MQVMLNILTLIGFVIAGVIVGIYVSIRLFIPKIISLKLQAMTEQEMEEMINGKRNH